MKLFIIFLGALLAAPLAQAELADLILYNGYIYTVDANQSVHSAVAIKSKKIIYVGTDEGVKAHKGTSTKTIDLKGQFVMPGFVDTHMHPFWVGWYHVNLTITDPYTVESTLNEIREYAKNNPKVSVIDGVGYMRQTFIAENGAPPTKHLLDAIDSKRPIMVVDRNGHSCWVNSKALELLGYDKNTPDPTNGTIERIPGTEGYGEPSGQLLEQAYFNMVEAFPSPSDGQAKAAIEYFQKTLNAYGITTIHDMLVDVSDNRQIAMYNYANQMAQNGELSLRVFGSWYLNPNRPDLDGAIKTFSDLSKTYTTSNFQVKSFKFLIDGIIEERTGLLFAPYCNSVEVESKNCTGTEFGFDIWTTAKRDLPQIFKQVTNLGFQINTHVIGDGAVKKVVEALEQANVPANMRPSLEHIQMGRPEEIAKMAKLGISANVSPIWMGLDSYFTTQYYPSLAFDRAYNQTYPYQSLFAAGVNVTTSSDWNVSEPNFGYQIFMGLTRLVPESLYKTFYCCEKDYEKLYPYIDDLNRVLLPSEFDPVNFTVMPIATLPPASERAQSIHDVLKAATLNGAKANFAEDFTGSLEVGKFADLVVLNTNYIQVAEQFMKSNRAVDLKPIAESKVLMTIFEGKVVYDASTDTIRPQPLVRSRHH